LPNMLTGSVILVTVIVLLLACSLDWVRRRQTGARNESNTIRNFNLTRALDEAPMSNENSDEYKKVFCGSITRLFLCMFLPMNAPYCKAARTTARKRFDKANYIFRMVKTGEFLKLAGELCPLERTRRAF